MIFRPLDLYFVITLISNNIHRLHAKKTKRNTLQGGFFFHTELILCDNVHSKELIIETERSSFLQDSSIHQRFCLCL